MLTHILYTIKAIFSYSIFKKDLPDDIDKIKLIPCHKQNPLKPE